jgi:hypothetical protein
LNYLTTKNLLTSKLLTWIRSGYRSYPDLQKTKEIRKERGVKTGKRMNHAINGMMANVAKRKRTAEDCIFATAAGKEDIEERNAERLKTLPKHPRYIQHSVWTDMEDSPCISPTACCTMTDDPLPHPPPEEFANPDAVSV